MRFGALLMATFTAQVLAAAAPVTYPARLATRDKQSVVSAACTARGAPGADKLDAWTLERDARTLQVEIRCKPHGMQHDVPLARITRCDNAQGIWRCDDGRESLQLVLPNDTVVAVVPNGPPAQKAIEAMREAAKLTIRPFYRPAVNVLKGECRVDDGAAKPKRGMESFEIRCGETVVYLTKDCHQGKCRYFIPFALNY